MATVGRIKAEYDETHYDLRPSAILIDEIGLRVLTFAWTDKCKERCHRRERRNYSAWAA
jgi:hypothetical protein